MCILPNKEIVINSSINTVQIGHSDTGMVPRMAKERKPAAASGKLTEDQVRKLKQDLEITQSNLDIFNELLTELRPGEVRPL